MTEGQPEISAGRSSDSFKSFVFWLLALFLAALGAQLWIVRLYGSPIPLWDQWYQAESLFQPWADGHLKWRDFFVGDSDHRMVLTNFLDFSLIALNGRWEPLLQMTCNAGFIAGFACGLAFCLWHYWGRKDGWLVCVLLLPFFALPYGGENAIWGINSVWYFAEIFALAAIVGIGFGNFGGWRWSLGMAGAGLSLLVNAAGLLAPVAAAGVLVLRTIKERRLEKKDLISLVLCALLTGGGGFLSYRPEYNRPLQAHSVAQFFGAFMRNLEWPFFHAPGMACVIALPLVLLLVVYLRRNFPWPRAAELLLSLALWSAMQSAVIAYGRANYSEQIPASRYMNVLNILVIASVFAAMLLGKLWERGRLPRWDGLLLPLAFASVMIFGLCRISQIVVNDLLVPTRVMNLVAEERVQKYFATGKEQDLFEPPTVRPDPKAALEVLSDKSVQAILPAACFSPDAAPGNGRFGGMAKWLLQYSFAILAGGLILFAGLAGFGLRGTLGLTGKNPAELLVFTALLTSLAYVGTKHSVNRQSITGQLERQIALNLKLTGDSQRAQIFEDRAGELKSSDPFAN